MRIAQQIFYFCMRMGMGVVGMIGIILYHTL